MLVVLAGIERPVGGEAVNRDQRAIQYHEGMPGLRRLRQRAVQLGGPGRQQAGDLGDVPLGGGGAHPEPGRQLSERLALVQVGQHQQRLLGGRGLAPA